MGATELRGLRARSRRAITLRGLPVLAAGLGAFSARPVQAQSFVDFRYLYYNEADGRTQVLNPTVLVHHELAPSIGIFDLLLSHDTISGASPNGGYPTLDVTTSASGTTNASGKVPMSPYNDHRESAALTYSRRFGAHLPSVDVSLSKEKDYTGREFGLSDAWTMLEGRGTLHFGASFSNDTVAPVTSPLRFAKQERSYALGWTWVLGEDDLLDLSGSVARLQGDLNDPYKIVPVGLTTLPDHRPDTRVRKSIVLKYGHYFPWDAALKSTYRAYQDDWSVRSNTLDFTYDQKLDDGWVLTPRLRWYSQSGASFYGAAFKTAQPYMSADYRLSPFSSLLAGLSVAFEIADGVTVSLGGTYQIQSGRDRLTPISTPGTVSRPAVLSGPDTSPADLNTTTFTAGIKWTF